MTPLTRLVCCWLALWSSLATFAQDTSPPDQRSTFEIQDSGRKQKFQLALDELSGAGAGGKQRASRIPAAAAKNLGEMRARARSAESVSGSPLDLVLYEEGRPRTEFTRRIATRRILVQATDAFDAKAAARVIGATHMEQPSYAPDHLLFTVSGPGESLTLLDTVRALPGVVSAEPLLARLRQRRLIPNDTFFSYNASNPGYQWHLRNTGQSPGLAGIDVNITSVWDTYTGSGIRIGIVDDGLEVAHPDLQPNADTINDRDWNDTTPDDPTGNPTSDTHGTACAGVAGARGNNGTGVSGAAPNATLVGLRLIAANVTDADEAAALTWKNDLIQLYSNSWGPTDDGTDLRDAGPLVKAALANGAATGRGGRGSIWMWAAGNGGAVQDDSNYDGYANSIYTISVGALNDTGTRSAYSEPGANVLICAPSNDNVGVHRGITTTTTNGGYRHNFGGTSSATPLAAGVVALLLQSNPNLGWRDVKEILLRSATKIDPTNADWVNNGAGYHFNHNYGAGLVNAQAAINLAAGWMNLGPAVSFSSAQTGLSVAIPDNNTAGTTRTFTVPPTQAIRVEHVTVRATATHGRRGDLEVTLTSPAGTSSRLFVSHSGDANLNLDWTFSSVRHWGETAAGNWSVRVADLVSGTPGTLTGVTLTLHGSNIAPPTAPPTITSALSASGNVSSPFSYQITASNNPQTFGATNLPPGLTISPSGLITGTPTQAGPSSVTLSATNVLGTGTATLVLTIGPRLPTPPVITSPLAATGVLNVPFAYQIAATNSPTSYNASGLPSALSINTATGAISGTVLATGTFNVTISATNADGTDTRTLVLTLDSAASLLAQALDAPQLVFTTGGDVPWAVPASDTYDGIDAAQSGTIGHNAQTWLETTVTGPVFVSFWFRLSSEARYDFFRFSIDGEELWYSDGEHAWRRLGFFVPAGIHTLRWNYTKDDIFVAGFDRLWLDSVSVTGVQELLGTVLDNPNLQWLMPGLGSWVMQDRRTIDGVDALISPLFLGHGRSSSIETRVMGPGTVTFGWTVGSELNADFFRFEIDNTVIAQISGNASGNNIPWTQPTYSVPAGMHTLRWRYIKNETGEAALDACWLDQIVYTPSLASGPPYAQWLTTHFPVAQWGNGFITGPDADADHDGRTNLDEYAFGGSPLVRDFAAPITGQPNGSEIFFDFSTDPTRTDLTVTPRLSPDLGSWTDVTPEFLTSSGGRNFWRTRVPKNLGRQFFQLRATLSP